MGGMGGSQHVERTRAGWVVARCTSTRCRARIVWARTEAAKSAPYDALAHVGRLVRIGASSRRLEAYRCRSCDGWHVGHRPKPRRKR